MDGHTTDAALRRQISKGWPRHRTEQGGPEALKDTKTSVLSYC